MSNHLGGIMLENEAGIEFIHTPFSSSSDILEALEKRLYRCSNSKNK